MVKLYKGSTLSIADRHTYKGVKAYEFALTLKSHYQFSYISDFKARRREISKTLNIDSRTLEKRIEKLISFNMAYFEGSTLRFLSYTRIKKEYASKKGSKYPYTHIDNISTEVRLQPIAENIKKQKQAIALKNRKVSNKKANCQSSFRDIIKSRPMFQTDNVNTTLLSQAKAAKLLGYRSNSSGFKQLKRLSMAGCLAIESNQVELTREQFNFYKLSHMQRLLIKGQGNQAKYYYLVANTVTITNKKQTTKSTSVKGQPYYLSEYW